MDNALRLKAWRAKQGLSQEKAAALIGAAQRTWHAWEEEGTSPDLSNGLRLDRLTEGDVPAEGWVKKTTRHQKTMKRRRRKRNATQALSS